MKFRTVSLVILAGLGLNLAISPASWADHTYSNNVTYTGPNGQHSTLDNSFSCSSGQCNGSRTFTGPNGQNRTINYNGNRTGWNTWAGTETVTNRWGQQHTFYQWRPR